MAYEILEHTADVGLRATAETLEDTFAEATRALADIIGVWRPGEGERETIAVDGDDVSLLLVDWLSEVLYLHDTRSAAISDVVVDEVGDGRARGAVLLSQLGGRGGTQVKAITYHRLRVEREGDGWVAEVYLDV